MKLPKTSTLLLFYPLLTFVGTAGAQNFYNKYDYFIDYAEINRKPKIDSGMLANHLVKLIRVKQENKFQKNTVDSVISSYQYGICVSSSFFAKGKLLRETGLQMDDFERPIYEFYKNKKTSKQYWYKYSGNAEKGIITERKYVYSKKNKTKFESNSIYFVNANGYQYDSMYLIKNRNPKDKLTAKYSRNDSGQIIRVSLYNHKGKLVYLYDYSCNKTGTLQLPKNNFQSYCIHKDTLPNGSKIIENVYETEFGIHRNITLIDKNNKAIYSKSFTGKYGDFLSSFDSFSYVGDTQFIKRVYHSYWQNVKGTKTKILYSNYSNSAKLLSNDKTIYTELKRYKKDKLKLHQYSKNTFDTHNLIASNHYRNLLTGEETKWIFKYQ